MDLGVQVSGFPVSFSDGRSVGRLEAYNIDKKLETCICRCLLVVSP